MEKNTIGGDGPSIILVESLETLNERVRSRVLKNIHRFNTIKNEIEDSWVVSGMSSDTALHIMDIHFNNAKDNIKKIPGIPEEIQIRIIGYLKSRLNAIRGVLMFNRRCEISAERIYQRELNKEQNAVQS